MIFLFGTSSGSVATAPLPGMACAHCGSVDTLTTNIFSRYFSVFWIPVFPLGKYSVTQCEHCKQVLTDQEMPAPYRAPVRALEQQARTPLRHFALLLLAGAGVLFILVVGGLSSGKSKTSLAAGAGRPASAADGRTVAGNNKEEASDLLGRRYKIALDNDTGPLYSLAKVTKVTADSVRFRLTRPLRGELSDASASLALRDSVDPTSANQRMTRAQWQAVTTGQGMFKPFD